MQVQRFLILSDARSGSNMLVSLLNSHTEIHCEGEVLHDKALDKIFFAVRPEEATAEQFELRERDPIAFLEKWVFTPRSEQVRATGFKLFYWQCQRQPWQHVWRHLRDMAGLKILHLKRRNQLHRHLSAKLAQLTKTWFIQRAEDAHRDVSIELDPTECREVFERTARNEQERAARFDGHPLLDLYYEDLTDDLEGEGRRIFEFLGVSEQPLRTRMQKQLRQPPREVISNYDDLVHRFAKTPWAHYFED